MKGDLHMKAEKQIMEKIIGDEDFIVAGGEAVISKKLSKIVAGIPIYNLVVTINKDFINDIEGETVEDILFKAEEHLNICAECCGMPEQGYYVDAEGSRIFCSYPCVCSFLDSNFGENNWRIEKGKDATGEFWVKVSEDEEQSFENCKKELDGFWRKYDITFVRPYYLRSPMDNLELYDKFLKGKF